MESDLVFRLLDRLQCQQMPSSKWEPVWDSLHLRDGEGPSLFQSDVDGQAWAWKSASPSVLASAPLRDLSSHAKGLMLVPAPQTGMKLVEKCF